MALIININKSKKFINKYGNEDGKWSALIHITSLLNDYGAYWNVQSRAQRNIAKIVNIGSCINE